MVLLFDVKIMACYERKTIVDKMINDIGGKVEVFYDDRIERFGTSYTQIKCLESLFEDGITHRCLLQDDLEICDDFRNHLSEIISLFPNAILTLFCSRLSKRDLESKANFVYISGYNTWGPGNVFPKWMIPKMLEWRNKNIPDHPYDDSLYWLFAKEFKIPIITTIPSLIQHLCPINSLLGYNNKLKVSKVWIGKDLSNVNWDSNKIITRNLPCTSTLAREQQMLKNWKEGKGWRAT